MKHMKTLTKQVKKYLLLLVTIGLLGNNSVAQTWDFVNSTNITNLNTGNVGIGTLNPTFKLDVNGNARFFEGLEVFGGNPVILGSDFLGGEAGLIGPNDDFIAVFYEDGSYRFGQPAGTNAGITIRNGNVGIGTTSPSTRLHIYTSTDYGLKLENPYGAILMGVFEGEEGIMNHNEDFIASYDYNSQVFNFGHGGLNIKNSNVGIGSGSPAYKLDVNGTVNATSYLINGQPFTGGAIEGITSLNGNIGVNEANPQEKLHLSGKLRAQSIGEDYYLEVGGDVEVLGLKHSHGGWMISSDDGSHMNLGNPNTQSITSFGKLNLRNGTSTIEIGNDQYDYDFAIKASDPNHGNIAYYNPQGEFTFANDALKFSGSELKNARFYGKVGIGTNALDEYGLNLSGQLRISDPQETLPLILGVSGAGQDPLWGLFVEDKTLIASEATSVFYIANNTIRVNAESATPLTKITGNVLINKTSQVNSNYKLDVNGNVRANEIVVNTTGADFVFEDDYTLRSLKEVEAFVNKNNHLPEIPSAKEMKENGVAVGALNTKLLQKIEELTLYMIELKKENDSLKERLNEVEQKVVNSKN